MAIIKKGKVITITSMKGGVGKTMSVLLMAELFRKNKLKTLIMDLDLYNGDIAFALDVDVKSNIYNLCDDIANNRYKSDSKDEYIAHYNDYIDILSSPKDPRHASKIDRKSLEIVIKSMANKYDVVLIDTNHILSVTNMVAFENSDAIVNVFTNDAMDLKSTKTFVSICKNINVESLYLALNTVVDERKQYFSQFEIESIIKEKINFIIPNNFYVKNIDKCIVEGNLMAYYEKILKYKIDEIVEFSYSVLNLLNNKEALGIEKE